MIHQPWGGAQGQAADIAIQAREIIRLKNYYRILCLSYRKTNRTNCTRYGADLFMSSEEAMDYGIVDHIMKRREDGAK